jgi:hypothetical protein
MKNLSKILLLICIAQCLNLSKTYAQYTYNWTGGSSGVWELAANWSRTGSGGTSVNYPGENSSITDIVQIGVANTFGSTRQPTLSNPIRIAYLTIGTKTATTLTINAALVIDNSFTQKNSNTAGGIITNLTGTGSITCTDFILGDGTIPPPPTIGLGLANATYQTVLNFSTLNLNISNNLSLTTTSNKVNLVIIIPYPSANVNNPVFNFNSGTISVGNTIQTLNPIDINIGAFLIYAAISSSAQFLMQPTTGNTTLLNLNGANAISLDANAGYVDLYCTCGGTSTVNYGGTGNQEVYTSTAPYANTRQSPNGLDRSPKMYSNLTFSGALNKTADGGNLTVANNLTLTASSTETVDFATNSPIVTVGGNFMSNTGTTLNQGGTGTMTITGTSNNAGTLNQMGSGNITFTGALNNSLTSATIAQTSTGTITASAGITNTGTISQGTGTIGAINITGTLTNTGTVTQTSGAITVTGNVANSGTLSLGSANLNISGNYTNTGTYAQNTGTTLFNGASAQTLQGGSGAGTPFKTVNFSGSGTKSMTSGNFSVSSTSVLTMIGSSILDAGGFLTLNSDKNGCATVAALPSGAQIKGIVNVQRFLTGGSDPKYRSYRILSSPVNAGPVSPTIYTINYLINSTFLTGTGGTAGGFDDTHGGYNNPTLYLFRENLAPLYTTFLNSNWIGISNISSPPTYSMNDITYPSTTIPIGNGYLFYFRGSRATPNPFTVGSPPLDATLTAVGILNQGPVTVKDWYNQGSVYLGFTNTTGNNAVKGLNVVGNPYASSVNWDTFHADVATATGIEGPGLDGTIYMLDPVSKNYGSYVAGHGGAGGTLGTTNIIASGQGFLVRATSTTAQLIFNEDAKTSLPIISSNILLGKPANETVSQYLRLKLSKDSINTDETVVMFNDQGSLNYKKGMDALYRPGNGIVSLSSQSGDQLPIAIKSIIPPNQRECLGLNVNTSTDGTYILALKDMVSIPVLFNISLIDAYKKDSVNLRVNPSYSFDVNKSDSTTFGSNRFSLVISQNPAYAYKLLDFNAIKAQAHQQVNVTWETQNEENYTNFTIERSTDAGKGFDVLGSVTANGQGNYSFVDKSPVMGSDLYRLKQVNINNAVSYSKIVTIQFANLSDQLTGNKISIYPNPIAGSVINLSITADNAQSANYNIKFMSSTGIVVKEITSQQASWHGNVNNLQPGTYIVRVINNKTQNLVGESKFVKL